MSRRRLDDRLAEVERLLAEGRSATEAAREAAAQYGVGLRQGQKYVARVFDRWAAEEREFRQHRRNHVRQVASHLYRECLENDRLSTAVSVLTLLCKLDGLFDQTLNVKHEVRPGFRPDGSRDPAYMTSDEQRRALASAVRKLIPKCPQVANAAREALAEMADG